MKKFIGVGVEMRKEKIYNTQIKKIPLQFVASNKKVALEALMDYIEFLGDDLFEEELK